MKKDLATSTVRLIYLAALLLIISIFMPIWRIELDAPQYPEGLVMKIYANKLGGDVDIINGLNHYIGMATLHAENFIEFTVLPYLIGAYALLFLFTAWAGKRKVLYFAFGAFVLFGIVSMIDFYRWEYNYGHNLDPNAAIIVPGMAYQPPLIGFKQLLNFGAYSIPDTGGWMFIGSGLLLLYAVLKESGAFSGRQKKRIFAAVMVAVLALPGCAPVGPVPIMLKSDNCDFCKMTIVDDRFGAELITTKGRVYKFDDVSCMVRYINSKKVDMKACYVHDFAQPGSLQEVGELYFVQSDAYKSPMGGNVAAFHVRNQAALSADQLQTLLLDWDEVMGVFK